MDIITKLLKKKLQDKFGGTNPADPSVAPQGTPPDVIGEDITVENTPFPKSNIKNTRGILEALFPSTFKPGTTAGNIYGHIKDGFLVQGGAKPMFAPRLQELVIGEALQDLSSDPNRASQMLSGLDNELAVDVWNKNADNQVQQRNSQILNQERDERYRNGINTRGFSLLKAATPETYEQVSNQVKRYFAAKGVDPDFDIPATFDEAARAQPWNSQVTPDQQDRAESLADYRDRLLAERRNAEGGRNYRARLTDGTRRSEGQANRSVKVSEGEKNREVRRETAKGGRARPKIRIEVVNGVRKIIKEQ